MVVSFGEILCGVVKNWLELDLIFVQHHLDSGCLCSSQSS